MDKFCSQCGAKVASGKFCEECGAPLEVLTEVQQIASEPEGVRIEPDKPPVRRGSGGRLPVILGGVGIVAIMLVGGWFIQKAKYSPEILDAFPPPEGQQQSQQNGNPEQPQSTPANYEDFVGNWIINQKGVETVFWIQEVENRYVGADDFTIMEFSEIKDRTMKGVITDGPEVNARVEVTLTPDSNGLQFVVTPDQKPEIRYEGVRNTSLGQGTVTSDDITAMEIMVKTAYTDMEKAQEANKAEKEAAFETAIIELGSALHTYYVVEGKHELSEAKTHLYEYLMTMNMNGFGMSEDYIKEMVDVALSP